MFHVIHFLLRKSFILRIKKNVFNCISFFTLLEIQSTRATTQITGVVSKKGNPMSRFGWIISDRKYRYLDNICLYCLQIGSDTLNKQSIELQICQYVNWCLTWFLWEKKLGDAFDVKTCWLVLHSKETEPHHVRSTLHVKRKSI